MQTHYRSADLAYYEVVLPSDMSGFATIELESRGNSDSTDEHARVVVRAQFTGRFDTQVGFVGRSDRDFGAFSPSPGDT